MSLNRSAPPHGTRRRYEWTVNPCRCGTCRQANALYMRETRRVARMQRALPLCPT